MSKILKELCRSRQCFGILLLSYSHEPNMPTDIQEYAKAAPWMKEHDLYFLVNGPKLVQKFLFAFFETREQMLEAYRQTTNADGPNEFNRYNGPAYFYAEMNTEE